MSRRIPLKVAPSPASQRPENKSVEKLVESSRKHQQRMRSEAEGDIGQRKKREPQAQARKRPERAEKNAGPVERKTDIKTDADQTVELVKKTTDSAGVPNTRRMTLHIPINTWAENRAGDVAKTIGKDTDYVIAAYVKRSIDGLRKRWRAGTMSDLLSDARLLVNQSSDGGTRPIRKYLAIDELMVKEGQTLFDDPLGLLSANKVMSAFLGAELVTQLSEA